MLNMIEIKPPEFDVDLYIAYALADNFTGRPLYNDSSCYLHKDAALLLQNSIKYAASLQLRLKIFDAYRPIEIQRQLWQDNPDANFLSNPETGSVPHCRGVAVDLTLVDANGRELDMGTGFDEFCARSFHGNQEISPTAQQNRHLLMGIMTTAGWDFYRNEWWHYQLFEPRKYPVIQAS